MPPIESLPAQHLEDVMLLSVLLLGCGEKNGSDTASDLIVENPNPQYIGEYNTNICEIEPASNGYGLGDVSFDFSLVDQHGETISLSDFCDNTVLLVTSSFWCGSCRGEAPKLEALYQQYKDSEFTVITMIGENADGLSPTQEDLQQWAADYGLTHPVVADPDYGAAVNYLFANPNFTGSISLPNMQLLSGGMIVEVSNDQLSETQILPYIEGAQ